MTGHNHFPDCQCGWCIGGNRKRNERALSQGINLARSVNFKAEILKRIGWPEERATLESFVNPNAECPICGKRVFFYESPNGGRVFFNELGPPWPKHECTDHPDQVRLRPKHDEYVWQKPPHRPSWESAGWLPVTFCTVATLGDWALLSVKSVDGAASIAAFVLWSDRLALGTPAYVRPTEGAYIWELSWIPNLRVMPSTMEHAFIIEAF